MIRRRTKPRILPERLSVGAILQKVGKETGIEVNLEPQWKIAGQIVTKSGKMRYFRSMALDLNTQGAAALASDKDFAALFLRKMGYPVVEGEAFCAEDWAKEIGSDRDVRKAVRYAKKLKYPVIVKPNGASQGKGVFLVYNEKELRGALKAIFAYDRIALVQKQVIGRDYRIVVLDGKIISAYERIPLSVTGDGHSTIKTLLLKKQDLFKKQGRDTKIDLKDPRMKAKLAHQKIGLSYRPTPDERVTLLENANLSSGGDAVDVTSTLHPSWKKLAAQIAHDMNLRFTGIDVMVPNTLDVPPGDYRLLEVNDSPGLDHYAAIGPAQKKVVEDLYRAVLVAMAR